MEDRVSAQVRLARNIRSMYDAHPFPNRQGIPPSRSDERFKYVYQEFLRIPLDDLKNRTVLDAGCGTGENTWSWRRILDTSNRVIAVDLSESAVRIARHRGTGQPLQPPFAVTSLANLGLQDNSVDMVFCSGVLHHIPARMQAFHELLRVMRPGGYIILVLYHCYGRALHSLRRAVIDLIERDDMDRRVRWGSKLFGRGMGKLAAKEQVALTDVLYDQFVLCESRHSVGEVADWFKCTNIQYLGTWPPVEWSQFGKALRFSYQLADRKNSKPLRLLLRFFRNTTASPQRAPDFVTRATMQSLWMLNQLQLFAISGRKAVSNAE